MRNQAYFDFHPGGSAALIACAGRDATEEFQKHHGADTIQNFAHLKAGRLVPEYSPDEPLATTEIILHQWVFDISDLKDDDPDLDKALTKFGGTNATAILLDQEPGANELVMLYDQEKRIVGGVRREELLEIPDEEVPKHDDPHQTTGAWVIVGELVYHVTGK